MKFWIEKPPILKVNSKNNRKKPNLPKDTYAAASFSGKSKAKSFEPSSGGIGSKLKIARDKL